jgi:hypothetical protein
MNYLEKQIDIQNGIINDLIKKIPAPKQKPVHASLYAAAFSFMIDFLKHQKRRLFRLLIKFKIFDNKILDKPEPVKPESLILDTLKRFLDSEISYRKKTLCFFVHYNQNNQTDKITQEDYLYIDYLRLFCDVVFITNSALPENDFNKIKEKSLLIIKRPNYGFDFGAWKDGLDIFGFEQIKTYEQLILANNSCYAPVFRLEHVFSVMDNTNADFWGITIQPGDHNFAEHIQSYFMVFNKNLVSDPCFESFWRRVKYELDIKGAIYHYEVFLTGYFHSYNYKYGAFFNQITGPGVFTSRRSRGIPPSPLHKDYDITYALYHDPLFLTEQGMPLIKKKSSLPLDQYYQLLDRLKQTAPLKAGS